MKSKVDTVLQILLGLLLLATGLNKFFHFMSMPDMPAAANALMKAFAESGYILPMVAVTEIVCGGLLAARRWSALALVLLAPLSVNIVLFHLVLAPASGAMAYAVAAVNAYLMWGAREWYRPLFNVKRTGG